MDVLKIAAAPLFIGLTLGMPRLINACVDRIQARHYAVYKRYEFPIVYTGATVICATTFVSAQVFKTLIPATQPSHALGNFTYQFLYMNYIIHSIGLYGNTLALLFLIVLHPIIMRYIRKLSAAMLEFADRIPRTYASTLFFGPFRIVTVPGEAAPQMNVMTEKELDAKYTLRCQRSGNNVTLNLYNKWCHICLEDCNVKHLIRVLGCNHVFHAACIDPWLLNRSATCPVCNRKC